MRPRAVIRTILLLGLIATAAAGAARAEDVPLLPLISRLGAHLEWDPYRASGIIRNGVRSISFQEDSPYFLDDERVLNAGTVVRSGGALMVSPSTAAFIEKTLGPAASGSGAVGQRRVGTIFIDPGHGGKDPGAIGHLTVDGKAVAVREKDVVLDVARRLQKLLRAKFPDKNIVLSRSTDEFLTLEERTKRANEIASSESNEIVFVSIHANASLRSSVKGFEVWYLPPEYRRTLIDPSEVKPSTTSVVPILNSMLEEEFTIESILLGKSLLDGLDGAVGSMSPRLGLKENSWAVVRNAKMPSVLVELGFVTNQEEGVRLLDDGYLQRLASGLYNGLAQYVSTFEQRKLAE